MTLEIIKLWIPCRVAQLLHPGDRLARAVEIASVRASERVTIFDERFHEWERRPVWHLRNRQCCGSRPIVSLKRIPSWNCGQSISGAKFQLWICFPHFGSEIHDLFRLSVPSFLQIGVSQVVKRM